MKGKDNMKQPAMILVLPVLYTILVLPVFLPESSSICNTRRYWSLQILEDSRKYWLYQYCRYWKILENTGNTSIADTGRFQKILVIPVLQILEDQVRSCGMYLYIVFFCPVCYERTQALPTHVKLPEQCIKMSFSPCYFWWGIRGGGQFSTYLISQFGTW